MNRRTEVAGPVGNGILVALLASGLVLAVGLTGDLARHVLDPPEIPDGILDGWHAVVDGGVVLTGLCLGAALLLGGRRRIRDLLPAHIGFLTAAAGLVLLVLWHREVGVENRIGALVSPPHLVLVAGLVLVLLTPVTVVDRRVSATGDRRLGWGSSAIVWSASTALLIAVNLLTGHSSALAGGVSFDLGYVEPVIGRGASEFDLTRGLTMILWFTVTISLAHTVLLRRFRPRPGFIAAGFAALAGTLLLVDGADGARSLALGLLIAGLTGELLVAIHGRPTLGSVTAPLSMGLVTTILWSVTFLALETDDLLRWSMPLVFGSILLALLAGTGAAALVGAGNPTATAPAATPEPTSDSRTRPEKSRRGERRRSEPRPDEPVDRPIDRLLAEFDEDDDIFTTRFTPSPPPGRPADRRRGGAPSRDRRIEP